MKTNLKRSLCVLLSVCLLIPAGLSVTAREKAPLDVWVIADCHYRPHSMLRPIEEANGLPGDPLFWHTNSQGQLTYEADAILNELLKRFEASSSNILLIAGDVTDDGYATEHYALGPKLTAFVQRTGKRIYLINGNHDINPPGTDRRIDVDEFKTIYAACGYDKALSVHASSASYTADLNEEYRLIAVDSCVYGEDGGVINNEVMLWVAQQAQLAARDGKKLIGMMHHSLLEHFQNQPIAGNNLLVKNYRSIASTFADYGIKFVFTGHVHANDISTAVSAAGNRIYDIETNALIAYPNSYRTVRFSDESVEIRTKYIDSIDIKDLPPGFIPVQLSLIQTDFPAYSYGYFKAGMHRFINEYIGTPRKVADALNLENGTPAYAALAAVMEPLGQALNLPLYDTAGTPETDSLEEIAATAGARIEPSEYKHIPEIVGTVLAKHYEGDETMPFDSPEIRIFLAAFKGALVYALLNIPVSGANALLSELGLPTPDFSVSDGAYTQAARRIYMTTAVSIFIEAVLKPLVESFTLDAYEPGDLNVTLEPYGAIASYTGEQVSITDIRFALTVLARVLGVLVTMVSASS